MLYMLSAVCWLCVGWYNRLKGSTMKNSWHGVREKVNCVQCIICLCVACV